MNTKEQALIKVQELVKRFNEQYPAYKKTEYNETQTRRDFIDPMFKALGWDIDNENGYGESYREVIHEDKVKIGSATKAPDYSFRLGGGKRLFFVEAKKPSVTIKDDIYPAYQVRRYGWSAKLNLSIITDFEEFAIYDCTKKPNPTDKASVARVKYITFGDYEKEWDFLWDTFSKESVLKGNLDRFISGTANKKGTATVDKEFLNSLDQWRTLLAEIIAKENRQLNEDELNFIVQQTLDRIIFLRIAEDRSIEPYSSLKECLGHGIFFQNLFKLFQQADAKYNSGLFDFKKDPYSKDLLLNNKTLKTIINQLYYPECPYEFSVLSVEILGSAYEQFLGKTITINNRGKAVTELKPEVRKAGGVYYTPQYIVDYIVENTVGKLCENKTPKEVSEIKIVDPACGSGSFLLGAYQYLLNWHKDYYTASPNITNRKNLLTPEGNLTTAEKKRILLNNIHGVDIDLNAVEVTKLSLLLKCLEGETQASIAYQMTMFHERVLPTLDDNIKSGNSLIDTDYYDNILDFGEEKKIKPFNWQKAFPEVFKRGGFDAVIGNPPYVKIQTMQDSNSVGIFEYFKSNYISTSKGNYDLYVIFIEKAYKLLNKKGILGFIQPHKFFQADFGVGIREFITKNKAINKIVHFGANQIFEGATTYTCLLFLDKNQNSEFKYIEVTNPEEWSNNKAFEISFLCKQPINSEKWSFVNKSKQKLIEKLNLIPQNLGDLTRKIFVGLQTSADKIYVLEVIEWKENTVFCYSHALNRNIEIEKGLIKPFLMGKDVKRYQTSKPRNVVIFPYNIYNGKAECMEKNFIKENFPLGWNYIQENKRELENREKGKMKNDKFYAYIYPKNLTEFEVEKIMTPDIANLPQFTFDTDNLYHTTTVFSLSFNEFKTADKYFILGLLNSKLMEFHMKSFGTTIRGGYTRFHKQYIETFRIKQPNFQIKFEIQLHDQIKSLVDQLLQLNKDLHGTPLQTQKEQIKRRIDYCEDKINELVFKLYDLTEDEIRIIEGK